MVILLVKFEFYSVAVLPQPARDPPLLRSSPVTLCITPSSKQALARTGSNRGAPHTCLEAEGGQRDVALAYEHASAGDVACEWSCTGEKRGLEAKGLAETRNQLQADGGLVYSITL